MESSGSTSAVEILVRIDDEEKIVQPPFENRLFPRQFAVEDDHPGIAGFAGGGQHEREGSRFGMGLAAGAEQDSPCEIGGLQEGGIIGLARCPKQG